MSDIVGQLCLVGEYATSFQAATLPCMGREGRGGELTRVRAVFDALFPVFVHLQIR